MFLKSSISDINTRMYLNKNNEIISELYNRICSLTLNFTDSISVNFIKGIIPYLQAAIDLCENYLRVEINNSNLENLAERIISKETEKIRHLKEIVITTCRCKNRCKDIRLYNKSYLILSKNIICNVKYLKKIHYTESVNKVFVDELYYLFSGIINLSENVLKYDIDCRLENICNNMILESKDILKDVKR